MNKLIKRSLIISLLAMPMFLSAAYLVDYPMTVTQPDGTKIHCFASGDEYYNWLHDANDYTIIQSQTDGYYYYAEMKNGELLPSKYKVGSADPALTGLKPNINISPEKRKLIREEFWANTPQWPESYRGSRDGADTLNNLVIYIRFSD
ncbi:MAG: hypothetical protein U5Q03_07385 [Bacteroidota bacterium]|nr:hypothetical protein [Bacteroidota bacterium]